MSHHYYHKPRRLHVRQLVSDYLRGVTVEFYVAPGVFSWKEVDEGTRILVEHAIVPEQGVILDLGCGYGVIGITLAKAYPRLRVVMVDINPLAVELAKLNAKLNKVEDRVEVLQGDLYTAVEGREFDAIISNPPLAAGFKTLQRIIEEAPQHLKTGGLLELVLRKGEEKVENMMRKVFGNARTLLRKKGYTILVAEKQ